MDQRVQDLLDGIPEKPLLSKLQPHYELIRGLRRKRRSYREIAKILSDNFQVAAAPSTIFAFLKVRSRYGDKRRPEATVSEPPQTGSRHYADPGEAATIGRCKPPVDMSAHIQALKHHKLAAAPRRSPPSFHYEEGEPLRLVSDAQKRD
jgi:hypothetical protein